MRKGVVIMFLWFSGVVVLGIVLWGSVVHGVEQPMYELEMSDGSIEVRLYEPMIVAEVMMEGERGEAVRSGFRVLADYIFGKGKREGGEKIAMTAPVRQEGKGVEWRVSFVMPSKYTMETLPKPQDGKVRLRELGRKRYVVLRFSGMITDENIRSHEEKLRSYVEEEDLRVVDRPVYSFYDPPWTLPFLRRNEVMFEVVG